MSLNLAPYFTANGPHSGTPLHSRHDRIPRPLYVVTTVFNAIRFRSRWKLYEDFAKRVDESGAILYTVEAAFGERDFVLTSPVNPNHIQLRTSNELWFKENMINVGVSRLPSDWSYVAWVDADISFARDDWADETLHQLQHYAMVQMFSQAQDLTPDHEPLNSRHSFLKCWQLGEENVKLCLDDYGSGVKGIGHPGAPGYAWACTRQAWDALGGLIDYGILGAADWHMAHALIDQLPRVMRKNYHANYKAMMMEWQARAHRSIRFNIGLVPGVILHYWHGRKENRFYTTRDEILTKHQYDPAFDLKKDWQGLYQLTGRSIPLRDDVRGYFRSRNEDSIDL